MNLEQGVESSFYTWQVPGKPLTIRVDFDVIDSVLMEVMQGYGSVPRRGVEVGGILLGSVQPGERPVVHIVDFEPVSCDHSRGPSYLLSESDRARFEETLERWRPGKHEKYYAVGMYRSQTREGMALSPDDLIFFNEHFPEPADVFLLVKPFASKPSIGAFFFREEGRIRSEASYLEFPFRRSMLGGAAAAPGETPAAANASAASPKPPAEDPGAGREAAPGDSPEGELVEPPRLKRNVWIPLSFIFLLVGVLLGFQAALSLRPAGGGKPGRDPLSLELVAEQSSDGLHVKWDRQAPAVARARGGTLTITDGAYNRLLQLDQNQLQNGSVIYRNLTNRVIFRLEVLSRERTSLVETAIFESVAPAGSPPPAAERPAR